MKILLLLLLLLLPLLACKESKPPIVEINEMKTPVVIVKITRYDGSFDMILKDGDNYLHNYNISYFSCNGMTAFHNLQTNDTLRK